MALSADFWRGRRVVVTGHTGFKGSWLSLFLQELGAEVLGVSLPPESAVGAYRSMGPWPMTERLVDIRDRDGVRAAIIEFRPQIVFHLAAQALVRRGFRDPLTTFETNVLGTLHVLDAAQGTAEPAAVVVVTSDKVYRDQGDGRRHRESDPLGGDDPYSASKACAELLVGSFRTTHPGAAVATARAGNVLGGGDTGEDRLVPDILRSLSSGAAVELRNPEAVRPWQHVLDPLAGYILLAARLLDDPEGTPAAVNFGPTGGAVTVRELTEQVLSSWGSGTWSPGRSGDGVPERQALQIDAALAESVLGWRPLVPLDAAIEWVVEWQRSLDVSHSARTVGIEQIRRYLSSVR